MILLKMRSEDYTRLKQQEGQGEDHFPPLSLFFLLISLQHSCDNLCKILIKVNVATTKAMAKMKSKQ